MMIIFLIWKHSEAFAWYRIKSKSNIFYPTPWQPKCYKIYNGSYTKNMSTYDSNKKLKKIEVIDLNFII